MEPQNSVTAEVGTELRKWVEVEKIADARTDEKMIRIFLQGCKNDAEEAKRKFRNFYKMKQAVPEWFGDRDPEEPHIRDLLKLGVLVPIPRKKSDRDPTVIVVRAAVNDPSINPMSDVFKVGMMVVELVMEMDDAISKNGVHVIIDLDGVGLGHALQMTPGLIKRAVHSWQDCYPIRITGIDFINCPAHVNVVLKFFRLFLRDKLKKRMRTHGRADASLCEFVDKNRLPREYGGNHGSMDTFIKQWSEAVSEHRDWFVRKCASPLERPNPERCIAQC